MKKLLFLVLILSLGSPAAGAAPLVVEALFNTKSRMPGTLIPFRVTGDVMLTGSLISVEATSNNGVDCRAMIDPFINTNFHVKCADETMVSIKIRATAGGEFYEATMAALEIKYPVSGVVTVSRTPVDPDIRAGKQLFGVFCVSCHSNPLDKKGKTALQISAAIDTKDKMKPLKAQVSAADLDKIAKYLGSL
jgi:hypothetical protein